MKWKLLFFAIVAFTLSANIYGQCVQCDSNDTPLGTNASRLGTYTEASGHSAFASGYYSNASGNYSTAIGHGVIASGLYSIAIGKNAQSQNTSFTFGKDITAIANNSFVIGSGYSLTAKITDTITNSIMLGIKSSLPTMIIRQNSTQDIPGSVGIGTLDPKQMLHVVGGNILISRISTRNNKAPGSINGSLLFGDITTNQYPYGAWGIEYLNDNDNGHGLNFWKTYDANGSSMNYVLFLCEEGSFKGNVGIGTSKPSQKLSVNGTIRSKEIIVELSNWPDFVFDNNYNLMTLKNVDCFIKQNGHLPNLPSAAEVEKEGIRLGEMNAILLQKIEELTLYAIELEKKIEKLEERIK